MKKLLVILMVVAMASFLFVGCMPGVTPEPDPTPDPTPTPNQAPGITSTAITSGKVGVAYTYDVNATDPDGDTLTYSLTAAPAKMTIVATTGVISWKPTAAGVFEVAVKVSDTKLSDTQSFEITVAAADVTPPTIPTTVAPIIIAQDAGALVNKAEAANGIIVNGTGRTYAEIKLFIGGVLVSSGDVKIDGTWIVVIAKAELGKDGAKTLYATATEPGYKESKKSNVVKFTLDTVLPSIKSSSAKDGAAIVPLASTFASVGVPGFTGATAVPIGLAPNLVPGLWRIDSLGAHATANNIVVTNPVTGVQTTLNNVAGAQAIYTIPGVTFTFPATWVAGEAATVNCVAAAAAVLGYIDVTFDAAVTGASILALTSVWNVQSPLGTAVVDTPSVLSTTVARIFEAVGGTLIAGDAYLITCSGISDLAGNEILATAPSTSTGIVLP